MFLHLGKDIVVNTKDIVGIFDLDTSTVSKITRNFLADAEKSGKVINVSEGLPKSFVISKKEEDVTFTAYISQISSTTLLKRSKSSGGLVSWF